MEDFKNSVDASDESLGKQAGIPEAPVGVKQPESASRNRKQVILGVIIVLVVLTLIFVAYVAYMLGKSQSVVDLADNIGLGTATAPKSELDESLESAPAEINQEYSGWNTFTNENYGYSFNYPSGWQVDRETNQGSTDWVSINPIDEANSSQGDVLAIYTYFDGTGCPGVKKKEFNVGGHTIEAVACPDDEIYRMSMKYSKTVSANATGIILAVAVPNTVGIQIDLSRGEDEVVRRILESVTGLTPAYK